MLLGLFDIGRHRYQYLISTSIPHFLKYLYSLKVPRYRGPIPRSEKCLFERACKGCDSPEKLKALLPRLEQELKDPGKFKDFYQFTFNFAKNPGQKGLGRFLRSHALYSVFESHSLLNAQMIIRDGGGGGWSLQIIIANH
ncbi:DCNL2 protein, partial [Polypterus senegalus]